MIDRDELPPLPKSTLTISVDGVEREVGDSMLTFEQIVVMSKGLTQDMNYSVTYIDETGRIGRMLPSERMFPREGMKFSVQKRVNSQL